MDKHTVEVNGKRNFLVTKIIHNVDLGEKSIDALNGSEHDKRVVLIASWKYNEFSQNV